MRACFVLVSLLTVPAFARADSPYIVLRDDGTLQDGQYRTSDDVTAVANLLVDEYLATDTPLPQVMSVWSAFALGGQSLFTLFLPLGSDIRGVGLDGPYGGDGTFPSPVPPLHAILLHNDVTDLPARAARHEAPVAGYARYLFLLELSHTWGPAAQVPGDEPDALIGFPFHWSFWMDAGGSPAGGNRWRDDGDGQYTTLPASPADVRYSMLDLYLMGLAEASEVEPFGLLVGARAPRGAEDPLNGGGISGATFPWFGPEPLTVTAEERRVLTIEDVVAANGARDPAFGEAPGPMTVGIVLVVRADATDEEIAAVRRDFDAVASDLAPAFASATDGRGALEIVTSTPPLEPEEPDAGPADVDAGPPDPAAPDAGADAGPSTEPPAPEPRAASGCAVVPPAGAGWLTLLFVLALRASRRS